MNRGEMRADVLSRLRGDSTYFQAEDINLSLNEGYEDLAEETKWNEKVVKLKYCQGHIYYDLRTVLFEANTGLANPDKGMRIDEFSADPQGPDDEGLTGLSDIQRERFALIGFAPGATEDGSTFLQATRCFNPQTNKWLIPSDVMDLDLHTYRMWESVLQNEPQRLFMRGLWWIGLFPRPTYDYDPGDRALGIQPKGYVNLYYRAIPSAMAEDDFTPEFPEEFHMALVYYALYDLKVSEGEVKLAMGYWKQYQELQEEFREYVDSRIQLSSYPGLR